RNNLTLLALYDQEDRLLSYGDLVFEYNDHGDLRKKTNTTTGDSTTYTYNQLGQLTKVTLADLRQITYSIDGEGKRQSKSVNGVVDTYYVYDFNGRLVAELNPSGTLRSHFVYATQSHSPDLMIRYGVTYRFAKDHLGSIRAVINTQTGEVAQQISYDEFGVVLSDTNPGYQPFGFAGGHYDSDTKLVRFGARDYDPEVGRWTSKDPILFAGGDTNLYGYVANDPINLIDPSGLAFGDWWDPSTYWPPAIKQAAENATKSMGEDRSQPKRNDTRHCYAACMASVSFGKYLTQVIGDRGETSQADLDANKCGRELSDKVDSYGECLDACTRENSNKR
ncbi:MAG: RHS repeat-associated core domain-containing protein, partial [Bdellovibrionales bacterium]|nr:RHS repeat-associated core domain-containing protein [Bdellovibrionales bacterium]